MSPDHTAPLGVGIVGAGLMGGWMATAVAQHPRFHLAAIFDPDATASQRLQRAHPGARVATSLGALVSDPGVQLVYLASPPAAHRAGVQAALEAARACLCEKPLAHSVAEAEAIAGMVSTRGLPFAVNFPFARAAAARRLAELVSGGALGRLQGATLTLRFARWPRAWQAGASAWLAGPEQGGFTREVLSHFVFLAQRLLGPGMLRGVEVERARGQAETALRAQLQFGDVPLTLDAAVAGDVPDHNRFELVGSAGSAALTGWFRLEYQGQTSDRADPSPGTLDGVAAMLDGRADHGLATAAEALAVVRCIEALLAPGA